MEKRMEILIGYDGPGCAAAALDDLQRAGLPAEVELLGSVSTSVAARAHYYVEVLRPRETNGGNHERRFDYLRN